MKVIYVAGPYRGPNAWAIAQNIRRAEELALDVWRLGAVALCPHLNSMHFDGVLPDETWLNGDLELMSRCDAVILAPGWHASSGAQAEVQQARGRIPVFECLGNLAWWLGKGAPSMTQMFPQPAMAEPAPHSTIFRAL